MTSSAKAPLRMGARCFFFFALVTTCKRNGILRQLTKWKMVCLKVMPLASCARVARRETGDMRTDVAQNFAKVDSGIKVSIWSKGLVDPPEVRLRNSFQPAEGGTIVFDFATPICHSPHQAFTC